VRRDRRQGDRQRSGGRSNERLRRSCVLGGHGWRRLNDRLCRLRRRHGLSVCRRRRAGPHNGNSRYHVRNDRVESRNGPLTRRYRACIQSRGDRLRYCG
jgi:hypothetical protein